MKSIRLLSVLFAASALSLVAGPIPVETTGNNVSITVQSHAKNVLGGGRFVGTIGSLPANSVDFWCVDSQILVSPPDSGQGNVTLLANIAPPANSTVRYGSVNTELDASGWDIDLGTTTVETAKTRYTMAAYLVSRYASSVTNSSTVTVDPINIDTGKLWNKNIQRAIWSIMSTNGLDATWTNDGNNNNNSSFSPSTSAFINEAIANYHTVDLTKWAVVSWRLNANGTALDPNNYQTFLVQVVPEPGFYGVLALGLSGVFLAVKRRKQS